MEFHHHHHFFFFSNVCHECVARYFPPRFTEEGGRERETIVGRAISVPFFLRVILETN